MKIGLQLRINFMDQSVIQSATECLVINRTTLKDLQKSCNFSLGKEKFTLFYYLS